MVNPPEIKNVSTKSSICGLRLPETSNLWIKYGYENGDFIMTCNKKSSIHIIKITKTIIVIPRACLKNHSRHLYNDAIASYSPLCVIFAPHSVDIRHCPLCLCPLRLLHFFFLRRYRNHCTRLCGDCQLLNTIKQILSLLHSY